MVDKNRFLYYITDMESKLRQWERIRGTSDIQLESVIAAFPGITAAIQSQTADMNTTDTNVDGKGGADNE